MDWLFAKLLVRRSNQAREGTRTILPPIAQAVSFEELLELDEIDLQARSTSRASGAAR